MPLDKQDLIDKLGQIEEQAKFTLADPQSLTKQRMKMIIALARYLRTEIAVSESSTLLSGSERHASENDEESNAKSA